MKKILTMSLAALLAFGAFGITACSKENEPTQEEKEAAELKEVKKAFYQGVYDIRSKVEEMKKNFNGTVLENIVYEIFVDDDGDNGGYITYLYKEKNTNNMYITADVDAYTDSTNTILGGNQRPYAKLVDGIKYDATNVTYNGSYFECDWIRNDDSTRFFEYSKIERFDSVFESMPYAVFNNKYVINTIDNSWDERVVTADIFTHPGDNGIALFENKLDAMTRNFNNSDILFNTKCCGTTTDVSNYDRFTYRLNGRYSYEIKYYTISEIPFEYNSFKN